MMSKNVVTFIEKWSRSEAAEQKNKDLFLTELCGVLVGYEADDGYRWRRVGKETRP